MGERMRILDIQHRTRMLGKLRTGTFDPTGRGKPVRSDTFIITSPFQHFVESAAETYGGLVEPWQPQGSGAAQWRVVTDEVALDAILPPGNDPLSQAYEKWSRGGVQRRCNGLLEEKSGQSCLCKQQWGEKWWENAPKDAPCKPTTRLNVILPDIPDIGTWLLETHSYNGATELPAHVDLMRTAIGTATPIPVRLYITHVTRTRDGQTKHFPVPAIELRGLSGGQAMARLLPGAAGRATVAGGGAQQAIEAAPPPDYKALIEQAKTRDDVIKVWTQAKQDRSGHVDAKEIEAVAKARVQQIHERATAWDQLVEIWPSSLTELEETFAKANGGKLVEDANADQLTEFVRLVRATLTKPDPGEDPVDAEIVEDADTTAPQPGADAAPQADAPLADAKHLRELGILMQECGITTHEGKGSKALNDEARFAWLSDFLGVPVSGSTKTLTADQAQRAIAHLKQVRVQRAKKRASLYRQIDESFNRLGVTGAEDRFRDLSDVLGRMVGKADDLSDEEVAEAAELLELALGAAGRETWDSMIEAAKKANEQASA